MGKDLSENVSTLVQLWTTPLGSLRNYTISAALTVLLSLVVYLVPPFRSASTLNRKLIHRALKAASDSMRKLGDLIDAHAEQPAELHGVQDLRAACWAQLVSPALSCLHLSPPPPHPPPALLGRPFPWLPAD